ncbi:T9SS type A sorting domain-containing protein [Labilibacter marinus]|uniref:T9SS type A sorting domain-containing protein n=1 Tax=Labilibacter marinus TaxID=1477105 RepID=UPI00095002B0|nr:T9SS type A sorting domain-containing protein [Labilibacter marinus]
MKKALLRVLFVAIMLVGIGSLSNAQTLSNVSVTEAPGPIILGDAVNFSYTYSVPAGQYRIQVSQYSVKETGGNVSWIYTDPTRVFPNGAGETDVTINGTFTSVTSVKNEGAVMVVGGGGTINFVIQDKSSGKWVSIESTEVAVDVTWETGSTDVTASILSGFKTYPNPAISSLNVEAPSGAQVEICNVAGAVVKSFIATETVTNVPVSDFVKGMYLVKVTADGETAVKKVLVK